MKPLAKELPGGIKLPDELRIHKRGSKERKAAGVALKEKMQVAVPKSSGGRFNGRGLDVGRGYAPSALDHDCRLVQSRCCWYKAARRPGLVCRLKGGDLALLSKIT
jgi:hypothetical protein